MSSSTNAPATTVIIPAYNQGHYLGRAIDSVLTQSDQAFEIIVVDDGSTDDTAAVARKYSADRRVRYIFQQNSGLSAARNTGIRHARGQYLSFLDSDDLFLPQKLALLRRHFERHPHLGLVAGQAHPIDEDGRPTGVLFDERLPQEGRYLLLGNPLHVGSVLLRRSWQEKVGLFDETLRSYEDWDMWLRLALAGCPMGFVDKPVSLYRFHADQMTRDGSQMTTATFAVLDNLFARSDLPPSWREMHDEAYSRAHLRAAAQSYRMGHVDVASRSLQEAVALDPALMAGDGQQLAGILAAWTELPKIASPLQYLARVYDNLPSELHALRRQKNRQLGELALRLTYRAYARKEFAQTRRQIWQAIRYRPAFLANRGVLSILLRAHAALLRRAAPR